MGDIGRENAWCESQQTTNGIFRTKIDRTAALDFAAQGVVIELQTAVLQKKLALSWLDNEKTLLKNTTNTVPHPYKK